MFKRLAGIPLLVPAVVAALSLGALALTACGDDDVDSNGSGSDDSTTTTAASDTSADGALEGTSWVLIAAVGSSGGEVPVAAGTAPSLDFLAGGQFSSTTGCNVLNGTYEQSGEKLTMTSGPMTNRACVDPTAATQEELIVAAFPKVAIADRAADGLTLRDGGGTTLLVYSPVSKELAGTSWTVTGVNNGRDAVQGTSLTEALTLEFGTDDTVSGNSGCNTFTGTYTQDGEEIAITDVGSTMMACEEAVATLEQQYQTALQAATTVRLSGTTLDLLDADGATQVALTKAG
jgi:heat shock protein HslJ